MNNVAVIKKIVNANSTGFFMGMLVKSEPISRLPMKLLKCFSTVSVVKLIESLTVYLFLVNGSKIGTKYFTSLCVGENLKTSLNYSLVPSLTPKMKILLILTQNC